MKNNSAWYYCLVATLIAATLIGSASVHAKITDLRVSVDKNPIMVDEAVQLIISAEGEISSKQIDLTSLEKDFRLSSTSISQSTRSINFNTTKTTTWVTQLFPKAVGIFTIPIFQMDGQASKAFDIIVSPIGTGQGAAARDFYLTAEINMDEVYLQQQVQYTTKLYLAKDIQRGSLQSPVLDNAIVKQVGENKEYEDFQNGMRYRVIERTYAIIPQASGEFTIVGTVFNGEAAADTRQSFGFISRTKPVNRVAPNIEITVLPIPDNYADHWLPSDYVELNEEWQQDPNSIILGQAITRTITLTAAGLVEEQLPEIGGVYPPDFKTYPDQPTTATVDRGAILFAQKIQSEAIIPNKVGTFVIGEVVVPWFNVVSKKTEFAKLPARSIKVLPPSEDALSNIQAITPANQKPQSDFNDSGTNNNTIFSTDNENQTFTIDWLHISLFLIWLVSLAVFAYIIVIGRISAVQQVKASTERGNSESELWKNLNKAVSLHNIQETNRTFTLWLSELTGQQVHSVSQCLVSIGAEECLAQFNQMMASEYADNKRDWQHTKLLDTLENLRNKVLQNINNSNDAFQLYPKV